LLGVGRRANNPNLVKNVVTKSKKANTGPIFQGGHCKGLKNLMIEKDGVDQDMRILEVKNWKKVALDRDEWAKLLKTARAHQGLSSQ
jgi:hypothetical protein